MLISNRSAIAPQIPHLLNHLSPVDADAISVDASVVQLKPFAEFGKLSDKKLPKQPIPIFKMERGGAMNRDTVKGFS